jgi:hypothetical protein
MIRKSIKRRSRSSLIKAPFSDWSNNKRRDKVIYVKEKIRRGSGVHGGLYASHHLISNTGRPAFMDNFVHVEFLSRNKFTYWNCTIETASRVFWSKVEAVASAKTQELITESGYVPERLSIKEFIKNLNSRKPKVIHEVLGNLSERDYKKSIIPQIILNDPPAVFESIKVDRTYESGLGLHIVIDVPSITHEVIVGVIERFLASGECEYEAEVPVPRESLPVETLDALMDKEGVPGYMLGNAMVRPKSRGVFKPGRKYFKKYGHRFMF